MYTTFYNLNSKPFQISSDPAFIWLGEKHKEALATLKYGVLDNKGFMLLTGDVGTGKTTLINTLIQSLSEDILYASVPDPRLELMDFLEYIARAFKIQGEFTTKGKFLFHFQNFLERAAEQGRKVLLLIDESQLLTQDLLEEIRLLSNIQKDGNNLLNIFFVGQDEFNEILDSPENRAVAQRLTLNYHLNPLSENETANYIRHRLLVAGTKEQLFDEAAVREIQAYSGGFPRRINVICDHCLLNGFVKEMKVINIEMVKMCAKDLKLEHYKSMSRQPLPPPRPIPPQIKLDTTHRVAPNSGKKRAPGIPVKSRSDFSWSKAVITCAGLLVIFFFLSPTTFVAKYNELGVYLSSVRDTLTGGSRPPVSLISQPVTEEQVEQNDNATIEKVEPSDTIEKRAAPSNPVAVEVEKVDAIENSGLVVNREPPTSVMPVSVSTMEKTGVALQSAVAEQEPVSELVPDAGNVPVLAGKDGNSAIQFDAGESVDEKTVSFETKDDTAVDNTVDDDPLALLEQNPPLLNKKVTVRFDPGSSDFYFADLEHVDGFVEAIKQHPDHVVYISGHTDSYGSEVYNYKLSLFRANMLKSFFLGKGIDAEQLKVRGFGSRQPIASNTTPEGRTLNRRVEIDVVQVQ
ncbi:AAA family ATPase [Desulfosediminicola flagellatus]|uniref:AAA family ATPase n=1 Tax=Desulfosediminicola flagellatus TaxID=2569541 RepID=UPI0010ACFD97|nr:AAA family ATPase [Desulfosediminicola flagellatus]